MTEADETKLMRMAIDAARKCQAEDDRIHPKVGVVVARDGKPPLVSYRGEVAPGDHAEYTALERHLADESVAGATIYCTLEPCTTRNHPKVPCADRISERKVSRVVIGMLDPNPEIMGRGIYRLRQANIHVDLFPPDLMAEVEELNRDFSRDQRKSDTPIVTDDLISENSGRRLDDWYKSLNRTYWNRNFDREPSSIFSHLVEVVGGLSLLASNKRKVGVDPESHIAKAIAWWMALCGKVGIKSVEAVLWDKFPRVCPYCQKLPHDPDVCAEQKAAGRGPNWDMLSSLGKAREVPSRLREWQRMFSTIYPAQQTEEYGPSFARLAEELGELAEAVRIFRSEPGYFLSEAADVFAWLMHIQNIVDSRKNVKVDARGHALEVAMSKAYPNGCKDCGKRICVCPAILPSTIGRIAHEVPANRGAFDSMGRFMTPERTSAFFKED
jgi:pyrimidine deaminase RibD-like protein/NTP pyrophosphatase (non-canonical NTP hydrolase)